MAILKHIASKNANYGSAIDYLKYQHDEFHLVPILDENGNMMLRDEFYLEGLNCDPETFDLECELLNQEYNKNNTYDEIKSHHYIISHDPRDAFAVFKLIGVNVSKCPPSKKNAPPDKTDGAALIYSSIS